MVIATVLKADNMTFHRFLNTKCLTTNNVKQIHILPIRRVQAKIFWAGKKTTTKIPENGMDLWHFLQGGPRADREINGVITS